MCRVTCLFSVKRVKSVMPSANATERNSLEFVLLTNEENHDLYIPPGWASAVSGIHLKGKMVTWCLLTWLRKTWVCRGQRVSAGLRMAVQWKAMTEEAFDWFGATCTYLLSLWRRQCPVTFMAFSGKVNAEAHVTSPVLYSLLNASLWRAPQVKYFWSVHCGSFPQQRVLNTAAYKMWESSEKRIN